MQKKQFDKEFEFALSTKQKNHVISKSNDLNYSGAEYIRLLIQQDILIEELIHLKKQTIKTINDLSVVNFKLNRNNKNG